MQYRRLGNTGLIVSRLALGSWTFGSGPDVLRPVQKVSRQEDADRLVGRALQAGVNFFNSADTYAGAEAMLGRALGKRRSDVVIATKVGLRRIAADPKDLAGSSILRAGLSRRHVLESIEGSLKRLGTDYIDLYLAHICDRYTPLEETLEAFDSLVRRGLVRYVGFSNWPAWLAAKALQMQKERGWAAFQAAEMYYSAAGRDLEQEFAPFMKDSGIGLLAWSPLSGGYLTGKYRGESPSAGGGRLAGFDLTPVDPARGRKILSALERIAAAKGASVAQIALAWLLASPQVTSILLGVTRLEQLEENLVSLRVGLSAKDIERIDAAGRPPISYPYDILQKGWEFDDLIERGFKGLPERFPQAAE